MVGRFVDGGYAEYVVVPKHNAVHLPTEIPFEHGAILMCSLATAFHALRKSRLKGGEWEGLKRERNFVIRRWRVKRAFRERGGYIGA